MNTAQVAVLGVIAFIVIITLAFNATHGVEYEPVEDDVDESFLGDDVYMTGRGQLLHNVHSETQCADQACVVHNPSDHAMAEFDTYWRQDRGLMERICEHGVGHPDPDDIAFVFRTAGREAAIVESVHGCDGCCVGAYDGVHDDLDGPVSEETQDAIEASVARSQS